MTISGRQIESAVRLDKDDQDIQKYSKLLDRMRPKTREECRCGIRPCPFVGCRYHLYLEVNPKNGAIKINFPDYEPWNLPVSCALDVAESWNLTLEEVGHLMNLTRERIRQAVAHAKRQLAPFVEGFGVGDFEAFLDEADDDELERVSVKESRTAQGM